MRKLILLILIVGGGGYLAYMISSKHIADYSVACAATTRLPERLKIVQSKDEINKLVGEWVGCIEGKKTFLDSVFYSKKKIVEGIKITQTITHKK